MLSLTRRAASAATTSSRSTAAALHVRSTVRTTTRTFASTSAATQTTVTNEPAVSPIAEDGRHEIWREGQSSDHDNEPR